MTSQTWHTGTTNSAEEEHDRHSLKVCTKCGKHILEHVCVTLTAELPQGCLTSCAFNAQVFSFVTFMMAIFVMLT